MGANSILRKIAKTVLYPLTNDKTYKYIQAVSKSKDIRNKSWYEPELDIIESGIKPGETAFDIGANFGIYAHYMSQAVGKSGRVYSFEPIPFTYDTLCLVSKIMGFGHNVELINKGCGNENATVTFTVPVQKSGALSTGQAHVGQRNNDREGRENHLKFDKLQSIKAEIIKLDDFLPDVNNLSMIKADIEGAELFCFRGAEKLIDKHLPTTICEINPWFLEGFGIKLEELTDFFTDKDYRIFHYTNTDGKRLREVRVGEIVEDNYVFIHPSRMENFKNLQK